jgi:hypothetical protein
VLEAARRRSEQASQQTEDAREETLEQTEDADEEACDGGS